MEIERINEFTVKFYITYGDIEDRGFDREEIWYNRERSEELFWEMMDEVNYKEDFSAEGPLWIQVQALDKGLEVIVTRAQLSKDGQKLELPISEDKQVDLPVDEKIESLLDHHFNDQDEELPKLPEPKTDTDETLHFVIGFEDFEHLIRLSHAIPEMELNNQLYFFQNKYYLYIAFVDDTFDEDQQDNILSHILEFGYESELTIYRIQEYGKEIMKEHALEAIREHFSIK